MSFLYDKSKTQIKNEGGVKYRFRKSSIVIFTRFLDIDIMLLPWIKLQGTAFLSICRISTSKIPWFYNRPVSWLFFTIQTILDFPFLRCNSLWNIVCVIWIEVSRGLKEWGWDTAKIYTRVWFGYVRFRWGS